MTGKLPCGPRLPDMSTLTAVVAGGGTTLDVSGSLLVTTPVMVPASIDPTGTIDVSDALAAWLNSLPAGSRATFPAGAKYRVDHTITLSGLSGVVVDGSGASFFTNDPTGDASTLAAPSKAARTRAHFRLSGCTQVGINAVTFVGPNTLAGTADNAYVSTLEAQHFVDLSGSANTDCFVTGSTASMIYGDFVYVGGGAAGVTVSGNDFHNNGRQGFSVTHGFNVRITGNRVDQVRRTVLDLEPNFATDLIDGVVFAGNTVGAHRLNFVSAGSTAAPVDNVQITDNVLSVSGAGCQIGTSTAPRKHNWTFSRNTATAGVGNPSGICVGLCGIDGFTAHGNEIALQPGRNMALFGLSGCTGIDVSGNQYPGGVAEMRVS
jgi:hypothetical protein